MIILKAGIDYEYNDNAYTLCAEEVCDNYDSLNRELKNSKLVKIHESGWTISARVNEDYFTWINYFEAYHSDYGEVKGDFESEIEATSILAFTNFRINHPPSEWDYMDI